jgi:sulfoxide reductase catalytic subunit YedY
MKRRRVLLASPPSSEITPEAVYLNRRAFLRTAGLAGAGVLLAACGVKERPPVTPAPGLPAGSQADELGDPLTDFQAVTSYNNYYEFTTDKEGVAGLAKDFRVRPWTIQVGGLAQKPATFAIDDLLTAFPQEERIYRLRCVEAWSMVIPWMGFELARLLDQVEPMASAAYVGSAHAAVPLAVHRGPAA